MYIRRIAEIHPYCFNHSDTLSGRSILLIFWWQILFYPPECICKYSQMGEATLEKGWYLKCSKMLIPVSPGGDEIRIILVDRSGFIFWLQTNPRKLPPDWLWWPQSYCPMKCEKGLLGGGPPDFIATPGGQIGVGGLGSTRGESTCAMLLAQEKLCMRLL